MTRRTSYLMLLVPAMILLIQGCSSNCDSYSGEGDKFITLLHSETGRILAVKYTDSGAQLDPEDSSCTFFLATTRDITTMIVTTVTDTDTISLITEGRFDLFKSSCSDKEQLYYHRTDPKLVSSTFDSVKIDYPAYPYNYPLGYSNVTTQTIRIWP